MARPTFQSSHALATALPAWAVAVVLLLQTLIAPFSTALPGGFSAALPDTSPLIAVDQSCCDGPSCCCGDPDICLCVAECPEGPLTPTRESEPARPIDDRTQLAILARSDALASPMAFTPRQSAVLRSTPRPPSTVRAQALLSIWLT